MCPEFTVTSKRVCVGWSLLGGCLGLWQCMVLPESSHMVTCGSHVAEVTYTCQRCTKRVPLGGTEQPEGENFSLLEDTSVRCSCFQLLLLFAISKGVQLGSHWGSNSG